MRYSATIALVCIFLLLALSSVIIAAATVPAAATLALLPVVAYLEHNAKFIGE